MSQRLKRVGPMSVAKALAVLYAAMGFLVGCIFALIGLAAPQWSSGASASTFFPMLGGIGALIVLPIIYAVLGFIGGLIFGALYNFVAGVTGGIEIELV